MLPLSSLDVIQLLEKLFKGWRAWDQNESYYLNVLLPELKTYPERGTTQEKMILIEIKKVASTEEWNQLEEIARNLPYQKKKYEEISRELGHFFEKNDFKTAEEYISSYQEKGIQRLYETERNNKIAKNKRAVNSLLDYFEYEKADLIFESIKPYLSDIQIVEYQNKKKCQQQVFKDSKLNEIRDACPRGKSRRTCIYILMVDKI